MSREMEVQIAATVQRQHGVVTRGQLLEAGLSSSSIGRRVQAGRLRPLHRGVYLVSSFAPQWAPEMAAILAGGPGAVLSHVSAARLWGLTTETRMSAAVGTKRTWVRPRPLPTSGEEPVDVTVPVRNGGRRPGIRVHRVAHLESDERTVRNGIPVTTPERTVVDLANTLGSRELEAVVARGERDGLLEQEGLARLVERHRGRTGIGMLRAVLDVPGGPSFTRSEAESRFLALIRDARLPPPKANVSVGPYEIDFLWPSEGIAVEVDGFHYHASRPRFEGDRRKDAWLLARGIKVIRLSWRQIVHEAMSTAVHLGQALARSRS